MFHKRVNLTVMIMNISHSDKTIESSHDYLNYNCVFSEIKVYKNK